MVYDGIDIAKYKHKVSVIDTDGKVLLDSICYSNNKGAAKSCCLGSANHSVYSSVMI